MTTSLKLLGVTLARCRCWLFILGYTSALGVSHAQSGSFIIPGLRGEAASDFAYWDLFKNEPGKTTNHNYDNPVALLDGTGMDDLGNLTSATAKTRISLKETATATCFVTSSGALYSFAAPTAFEAKYTPPPTSVGAVTNVIFQTQTGGTRMDVNNIRLVYTGTTPTGFMTFEVAPNFKGLDDPQTGGFSERLVSAFQWDLTGRNVRDFKIVFTSPASSMPLWQAQIDAVIGETFVQELGFLLSTHSRPITRFGRVGSIDKNLPADADGRFFHQGEQLNLLGDPETGWMHTGWYYNGASSNGNSLPFTFPAQDIIVTALFAPQNYTAWREAMFNHANSLLGTQDDYTNDAISAKAVDSDNDGLSNAGEYAFSGDVYSNDPVRWSPQMLRVKVNGVPHLAIRYRTNGAPANHADTVFKAQLSINGGGTWTDNSTVPTTTEHSRVLQSDGSALVTARTLLPLSEMPVDAAMRIDWTASGVHGDPLAPLPLGITTNTVLNAGRVGVNYATNIVAAGGTAPYLWEVTAGTLPAGLSLNSSTGLLSGLPSAEASAEFTVQITDANHLTVTKALQLTVQPFFITTASPLPGSLVNVPYNVVFAAAGGTAPFTWTVSGGTLPAGLALSNTGVLSGPATTAAAGTSMFTVQITDANQFTATKQVSVTFVNLLISTASSLPGAVKDVPYSLSLTGQGGTAPYAWEVATGQGTPPAGLTLSPAGVLSGVPSGAANTVFTVRITDANNFSVTKPFTLSSTLNFVRPVINPISFANATIGANYTASLTASSYPKSFTVTGLPRGLAYKSITNAGTTTCEISGRPAVSGVFSVQVRATNDGGSSTVVTAPLVVKALPSNLVGTFSGIIFRNAGANSNLGSKLSFTTTTNGSISAKLITGSKTTTATAFLSASAPQVALTIGGKLLSLTLANDLVTGTHGEAEVNGWRSTWHAVSKPASTRDGYYSLSMKLGNEADDGVAGIPQGHGYATFTVSLAGAVGITGMTADGQKVTSADVLGPQGQLGMYALLYASQGTLHGPLTIGEDIDGGFLGNDVTGALTWSKPATTGKIYAAAFATPVQLDVEGGYLAATPKGGIVLSLPEEGAAQLRFTDGGLADSSTDPDVAFTYTHDNKAVVSTTNPGRASLTINATTGAVSGKFTLTENTTPALVRKDVPFQGQVVRSSDGSLKAAGYFLLPQIPPSGQKASTLTLSGGVSIQQ